MIYRIDFQHFLLHAIDHFTRTELLHFQYLIVSANVKGNHKVTNVEKCNDLYPRPEAVIDYAEDQNKNVLEARMFAEYKSILEDSPDVFYKLFLNMLAVHNDLVIVCDKTENDYIDVLCKFLKKEFGIEVIDLNRLFTEGRVGSVYIDRDAIMDRTVDFRRAAAKAMSESLESTREGRMRLVTKIMNRKQKLHKLRELGIKVRKEDMKNLDQLLIDAWVEDEDDY